MGSDIAVDAADIVLVNDRVEELPHLLGQCPQQGLLCRNAGLQTIQPIQQFFPVRLS